jgi:hypothetical protein
MAVDTSAARVISPVVSDPVCLPSDASAVFIIRPAELAAAPIAQGVASLFDELLAPAKMGLKVSEIEEFKVVVPGGLPQPGDDSFCVYMILRSRQPHDWKKALQEVLGATKEDEIEGQKYFKAPDEGFGSFWIPDERTIVYGTPGGLARTLSTPDPNDRAEWADKWTTAAKSPLAGMLQLDMFGQAVNFEGASDDDSDTQYLSTLVADGRRAIFHCDVTADGITLIAALECDSADAAERVALALGKGLAKLAVIIAPTSATDDDGEANRLAIQVAKLVAGAQITHQESTATMQLVATTEMVTTFVDSARALARSQSLRQADQKKLEQIAAAMTKYHDANDHFPPSAVIGPDGKTVHSWRVEILPYLDGGNDLYDRYRMNEPWTSEHNQAVMKDGVDLFAAPRETVSEDAVTCGYFLITGKGTLFDGETKPTRGSVTDGVAKTIMLVEAQRQIPWSKPEDIECDPDAPLQTLGGNLQAGYVAARVDGTVLFITMVGEPELRSLFTKAAGDGPTTEPESE